MLEVFRGHELASLVEQCLGPRGLGVVIRLRQAGEGHDTGHESPAEERGRQGGARTRRTKIDHCILRTKAGQPSAVGPLCRQISADCNAHPLPGARDYWNFAKYVGDLP